MLSFQLSPKTKEFLDTMSNPNTAGVFIRKKIGLKYDMVVFSVLVREAIDQAMRSAFPTQWKHFKVDNTGSNQYGMMVSVRPVDDVGTYLWYGTLPHYIEAMPGYALEFTDSSGEVIYRESVFVSGIKEMKTQMETIIDEAIVKVTLLFIK